MPSKGKFPKKADMGVSFFRHPDSTLQSCIKAYLDYGITGNGFVIALSSLNDADQL